MWEALRSHPGATTTELATLTRVTRARVAALIQEWAGEGSVTATPSRTARAPQRWAAAPSLPLTSTARETPTDRDPDGPADPTETAVGVDTSQSEAATADDPAGPARTPTHSAGQNESEGSPTRANPRSGSTRLAAGALEGLIEEFLTEHPGEHGPTAVAKAIRRSSGAVANALERMVTSRWATRTCDKPKRYRIADPSEGSGDGAAALAPTGPTGDAANAIEPECEPDSGAAAAADNQAASAGARAAGDGGRGRAARPGAARRSADPRGATGWSPRVYGPRGDQPHAQPSALHSLIELNDSAPRNHGDRENGIRHDDQHQAAAALARARTSRGHDGGLSARTETAYVRASAGPMAREVAAMLGVPRPT